ncbi:MAG: ORF6N domain-containing protein [Oscillospiraceae bacterium]|nr:ORF6N domain-containing protein [Oscillospiraceae bacterium]
MNVPKVIERAGERVLTTAQLAEAYGTDAVTIKQNYNNNKRHYAEGKHFFLMTGDSLRQLKREVEKIDLVIPKNVNRYYLWTERGALLHAKSINTDTAWRVYEELVECYFRAKEMLRLPATTAQRTPMTAEQREQKRLAVLVGELRFRQSRLADAEAKFAQQKAEIAFARVEFTDWVMFHPELMPYVNNLLPMQE